MGLWWGQLENGVLGLQAIPAASPPPPTGPCKHTNDLNQPQQVTKKMPPPLLSSTRLCVTVPSHPRGNLPQVTVPSPPRLLDKRRATQNKKANTRACEPQSDQETVFFNTTWETSINRCQQ